MKSPKPPQPTDPLKSSSADQQAQTGTAIAQMWMNNPQRYNPYGSQTFLRTGTQYTTDAQGKQIEVPTMTETITFSPDEQKNYDYENKLNWQMSDMALRQLAAVDQRLSEPLNVDGLPEIKGDYDAYRAQTLDKMRQYMSPELDRQQQQAYTDLKNRGIGEGSEAYREAQALMNRQRSDADLQMYLGAGSEIDRAYTMDSNARERALQERLQMRNQPINEITALTSGLQVNSPQFAQYQPGTIRPTDVAGQYNHYDQMRMQAWQAQQQQRSAMMSGLFGLGSAAIGGMFRRSDARMKSDIVKIADDPRGFGIYEYTIGDKRERGVLAQEVAPIVPHAVKEIDGILHVNYGAL